MKKLFLILLIPFCIYGQTFNVTFSFDSAATVSDSIQLDRHYHLSALFVEDSLNLDSFYVQVYVEGDTATDGSDNWYYVYEAGAKYVIVGSETDDVFISLKPLALYSLDGGASPRKLWVRLVLSGVNVAPDVFSLKAIRTKYD